MLTVKTIFCWSMLFCLIITSCKTKTIILKQQATFNYIRGADTLLYKDNCDRYYFYKIRQSGNRVKVRTWFIGNNPCQDTAYVHDSFHYSRKYHLQDSIRYEPIKEEIFAMDLKELLGSMEQRRVYFLKKVKTNGILQDVYFSFQGDSMAANIDGPLKYHVKLTWLSFMSGTGIPLSRTQIGIRTNNPSFHLSQIHSRNHPDAVANTSDYDIISEKELDFLLRGRLIKHVKDKVYQDLGIFLWSR